MDELIRKLGEGMTFLQELKDADLKSKLSQIDSIKTSLSNIEAAISSLSSKIDSLPKV